MTLGNLSQEEVALYKEAQKYADFIDKTFSKYVDNLDVNFSEEEYLNYAKKFWNEGISKKLAEFNGSYSKVYSKTIYSQE